jgi:hypothetical protein
MNVMPILLGVTPFTSAQNFNLFYGPHRKFDPIRAVSIGSKPDHVRILILFEKSFEQ